jgi:transaldolase
VSDADEEGDTVKPTQLLHQAGQSIWLDNITRALLTSGTLQRYVDELSVTGLTSNPSIFDKAIESTGDYDDAIAAATGSSAEDVFFELALEDLQAAADVFAPVHERTSGVDGWVSLEVSPLLAYDAASTIREAKDLHARASRPNLFIKIPGTTEGLVAIEESIFAGVPVNITLLFSREQYLAQAEAYIRGIERRVEAGLDPAIGSVASVFVSRWDGAIKGHVPAELENRLGVAACKRTYAAYRQLLDSGRWQQLESEGARPQRLLFASTSTKDPSLADTLYVTSLAAPNTVDTMPEATLLAFADHGEVGGLLPADGGDADELLAAFERAGVDLETLAARLQSEGAEAFDVAWNDLLSCLSRKVESLATAR